jgi:hypothetical protein
MQDADDARVQLGGDAEQERSANACDIAAAVLQELGEKLGPQNDHGPWFLDWARRLQRQSQSLRGKAEEASGPPALRVVQ